MRFKPGTTNEEAKAKLAAFAEKQRNADIGGTRPYGGSMNLGTAAGPGGGRPGMGVPPSSQVNPRQPNVMGFPDRPMAPGVTSGRPAPIGPDGKPLVMGQIMGPGPKQISLNLDQLRRQQEAAQQGRGFQQATGSPMPGSTFGNQQAPMMTGPKSAQTTPPPVGLPAIRGAQDPMGSQQATQQAAGAALQGFANKAGSFFKKGGAVTTKAKAPVKKAAGGKVAAKAPVKKAMGGPIKAKTAAKPAAKMAKPMPAMKRGGKVMAKGRKK